MAKDLLQVIPLSARLGDVLTDESVDEKFSHIIRLNTRFIPRRVIRLRQTIYPSQTDKSSLIQIWPMTASMIFPCKVKRSKLMERACDVRLDLTQSLSL